MEKKWWYSWRTSTQLLFILLWVVQPTLAKSTASEATKKGKGGAIAKPPGSALSAKQVEGAANTSQTGRLKSKTQAKASASRSSSRSSATLSAGKGKGRTVKKTQKRVGSRKSRSTAKMKKEKKSVTLKTSKKTLRIVKSRKASLSRRSTARHRKVQTSSRTVGKGLSVAPTTISSTRRELIARNYDGLDITAPYSPEIAPFPVQVNDEWLLYRINSVFVLPGDRLTLSVGNMRERDKYILQPTLAATQIESNTWSWKAPHNTGVYPFTILHPHWGTTVQLNVFVMNPFSSVAGGLLNGYRIGHYPAIAYRQMSTYTLPRGFIEVTEENAHTRVSPHFTLRQFLCKQDSAYPKYIALDSRLLIVLEAILQKINERGHQSPTLSIMSGYRTPYYNRAIGNSTTYSRHLWGDAADIFVDAHPLDGEMDDLNRDGVMNKHDTEVLYDIVAEMYEPRVKRFLAGSFFNEPILQQLVMNGYSEDARVRKLLTGGLARYRETGSHGPFVHVDVRGVFTRWGR